MLRVISFFTAHVERMVPQPGFFILKILKQATQTLFRISIIAALSL